MKVGYVLTRFPVLTEIFVINEICTLIDLGIDVRIFTFKKEKNINKNKKIKKYKLIKKTTEISTKFSKKERIIESLRHPIQILLQDPFNNSITSERIEKNICAKILLEAAKKEKIDIFHCTWASLNAETAIRAAKINKIPVTTSAIAYDLFIQNKEYLKKIFNYADQIVAISDYNKKFIKKNFPESSKKIKVIKIGLPVNEIKFRKNKIKKNKIILHTGRLVEKKGTKYLIQSMPDLIKKDKKLRLLIVGDGPLRKELEKKADELKIRNNVLFLGNLSDKKYSFLLNKADLFVLPCIISKNKDRDGIPIVLMEAMASGVPVISTKIASIPELIDDSCGILVKQKNEKELTNAIKKILYSKINKRKLVINARKKIETQFNMLTATKNLISLWNQILLKSRNKIS